MIVGSRKNFKEYPQLLIEQSRKALFWLSLVGFFGISYISIASSMRDLIAGLVYLPLLLTFCVSLLVYRFVDRAHHRSFLYLSDLIGIFAVLGASLLVIRADSIGFTVNTSPIQYSLLFACSICFHQRKISLVRNLALVAVSVFLVGGYSWELVLSLKQHYVFGFLAGGALYLIYEDRAYKEFYFRKMAEKQRENSHKQLEHLSREFASICMPHQLDLIYAGRRYTDTMPTNEADFWMCCSSVISEKIDYSDRSPILFRLDAEFRELFSQSSQLDSTRGYYSHRQEKQFFVSYDYPFLIDPNYDKAAVVFSSLLDHIVAYRAVLSSDAIPILALSFERGYGAYSGSTANYLVNGLVRQQSERMFWHAVSLATSQTPLTQTAAYLMVSERCFDQLAQALPAKIIEAFEPVVLKPSARQAHLPESAYRLSISLESLQTWRSLLAIESKVSFPKSNSHRFVGRL